MKVMKTCTIAIIGAVIMWILNPSIEQHRSVASNHIRTYVFEKEAPFYFQKWYLPDGLVYDRANEYSRQLAHQIKYESYIIFSITRLRNPRLDLLKGTFWPKMLRPEKSVINIDTPTSIGFLGMVF